MTIAKNVKPAFLMTLPAFAAASLSLIWVCSPSQVCKADTSIQTPFKTAPVNPDFISWHNRTEKFGFKAYDEQGHSLGYVPSPFDWSHLMSQNLSTQQIETLPSSYDLRAYGYVTPVRNQAGCGSCWAFATYGSLESWLLKHEDENRDFSENHLKNYHGFDSSPCEGGSADMSTAYLARWSGPVNESDDPYHDYDDRPSPGGPIQKILKNSIQVTTDTDIKNAVMTYGALYTAMRYELAYHNLTENTYFYPGTGEINHAVTIVGWDDYKIVSDAPANGAWLIKNSWGADWGEDGYFWISYYDSAAVQYAVAFCDAIHPSSYPTNYQYDPLGLVSAVGTGITTCWGANIFTASDNYPLGAVGFYALAHNTSYEIYVYDNFNGTSFSTMLGSISGTVSNAGYHTITLPSPIALTNGDDFAIVIKFTTPDFDYPVPMEDPYQGYSSAATANAGESYISTDGSVFDDMTAFFPNANACIKGFATYGEPPTAQNVGINATAGSPADIILSANDDSLPNPPGTLSYIITSLPALGILSDPFAGSIDQVPYTLVNDGNIVTYTSTAPCADFDSFSYKANDGGTPPHGGDSDTATVEIIIHLFFDDFPVLNLNTTNWTSYSGEPSIDTGAQGEISPPYSLHLEETESVTSKQIDLSHCLSADLQYFWQRQRTEAGDNAYIDYWDGSAWKRLMTHLYNEANASQFYEELVSLPPDALIQQFRLRFKANCDGFSDEWYFDNIKLTCICCNIQTPDPNAEPKFTKGTTNTITWTSLDDSEYLAVCADDVNFSNIVASGGWTNLTEHTFTNLEPGNTYWYRVKARNEPDETAWMQTEQAEFEMDVLIDANATADGNVVLAGSAGSYAPAGSITSTLIDLPEFWQWDIVTFNSTIPDGTHLYIDIIDANDPCEPIILEDVVNGYDLSGLQQTKIKLHTELFTENAYISPILHDWSVSYVNAASLCQSDFSNKVWSVQCGLDGDFQPDCIIDSNDLYDFSLEWLNTDCNDLAGDQTDWCSGADITQNGTVDFADYARMAENWMICIGPFCE